MTYNGEQELRPSVEETEREDSHAQLIEAVTRACTHAEARMTDDRAMTRERTQMSDSFWWSHAQCSRHSELIHDLQR